MFARVAVVLGLAALLVFASTAASAYGDATVTDCTESGLNEGIGSGGTITFQCAAPTTIAITSTKTILGDITIDGGGLVTLDGQNAQRIFKVGTGARLTLKNIALTRGGNGSGEGGAIHNSGRLTVQNSSITSSSATQGGAIYSADWGATTVIDRSTLANNTARSGGAIFSQGVFTITASTFQGNAASAAEGSAITAGESGTITNSTIVSNTNSDGGAVASVSPGIDAIQAPGHAAADITILNSTIADNTGAGIYPRGGRIFLKNTIVANNSAANCSANGLIVDNGGNLSSDASCPFVTARGSLNDTDAKLGPLKNNGGPTLTRQPLTGSPAIDAGVNDGAPAVDQRGAPRPMDGNNDATATVDIGAVEVQKYEKVYIVGNVGDSGPGSLRQAILDNNTGGGGGAIIFTVGSGAQTINLQSPLPPITQPIIIDGSTQPNITPGTPGISLTGSSLVTVNANSATLQGLSITGFTGTGIAINGSNITLTGNTISNNTGNGVAIGGNNITLTANTITNNGSGGGSSCSGIFVASGASNVTISQNTITGNKCNGILSNGTGVQIVGNTISGNGGDGVQVGSGGSANSILSNSIKDNTGEGINLVGSANNSQQSPALTFAALTGLTVSQGAGSGTAVQGTVSGAASTAYRVQVFANQTCDASGRGEGATFLGETTITLDPTGSKAFVVPAPLPASGLKRGQSVSATATDSNGNTSAFAKCVGVQNSNELWYTAWQLGSDTPPSAQDTTSFQQFLVSSGESAWYKTAVGPGCSVDITVDNLPAPYNISLFSDLRTARSNLADQNASVRDPLLLSAKTAPLDIGPLDIGPLDIGPLDIGPLDIGPLDIGPLDIGPLDIGPLDIGPLDIGPLDIGPLDIGPLDIGPLDIGPLDIGPLDIGGRLQALTTSLLAVDTQPGTAPRRVVRQTFNNSGDYYVHVRGLNGAYSTQQPFRIQVTRTCGECANVAPIAASVAPGAPSALQLNTPPAQVQTVIVTNSLTPLAGSDADRAALQAKLANLASATHGVIIDVGKDARVQQAYAQFTNSKTCPSAANVLATEIKRAIDTYRSANNLQYVVLVGDDAVLPNYRSPDNSNVSGGREVDFRPAVNDASATRGSLGYNMLLDQDFYGTRDFIARADLSIQNVDLAVGRLVGTAAQASAVIDAYTAKNGSLTPTSGLVSGYDFFYDTATQIANQFDSGMAGPVTDRSLLWSGGPRDTSATGVKWTTDQLKQKLFAPNGHDLVFLGAHATEDSALAANYDYNNLFKSADVQSDGNFLGTVLISIGCHLGLDVPAADKLTTGGDWVENLQGRGATVIAATSYQLGDTDFIAYHEKLYLSLAQQLNTGSGPVAIGKALLQAKTAYRAGLTTPSGLDEKVLLSTALYGLPMYAVNMPNRVSTSTSASIVPSVAPLSGRVSFADISRTLNSGPDALTLNTVKVPDPANSGATVAETYLSGPDGVLSRAAEPVQPLVRKNVTVANYVARGVGFRGGAYVDTPNITPLTGATALEQSAYHPQFFSTVMYPRTLWNLNFFDALAPNNGPTWLNLTPSQYQSESISSPSGTLRQYTNMALRLFYVPNTDTDVPAAAPAISNVYTTASGNDVTFNATVHSNTDDDVLQVWVTYTSCPTGGPCSGQWTSLDLTRNSGGQWIGTLTNAPSGILYVVQAVNSAGLVSLATNSGGYYPLGGAQPSAPTQNAKPLVKPILSGTLSGTYLDTFPISVQILDANTNTCTAQLQGQPLSIILGSQRSRVTTDSTCSAALTPTPVLSEVPGSYTVGVSFAGNDTYLPISQQTPLTINKLGTSLSFEPPSPYSMTPGVPPTWSAVLTDNSAKKRAVTQQSVILVATCADAFQCGGSSASVFTFTDYLGRATFWPNSLPIGTYNLTAYFVTPATLPDGTIVQLDNDRYLGSTATTTFTVRNVAPMVDRISGPTAPQAVGAPVLFSASFTDPDPLKTHTAVWDWGDGTRSKACPSNSTECTLTEANGSGTVVGTHAYSAPSVYTVKVTVTGNTGASGQASLANVTVQGSSDAFITGGGSITCPATAPGCGTTPIVGGKASFSFNVRSGSQPKGTATGNLTLQFQAGNLSFKSTQFTAPLSVAGNKAIAKGKGTVNGSGGYSFMLSVIDSGDSADQLRLRITDADGHVVFDNDPNNSGDYPASNAPYPATVSQGGSITIHR
ncbi:MAG: right-handed parallel beta-helix repeat-containing protein [Anaerolineae bacterium]